jgi:hypothetical protein
MNQFDVLMNFVRETREQQQKYLETINSEHVALIEKYRAENTVLLDKIETRFEKSTDQLHGDLKTFSADLMAEIKSVRAWYASTIVAIILAAAAIIFSK